MTNSVTAMRVGVCYKDKAWAVEQIKRMASLINPDAIEQQRDLCVELKDGSYIKGIPCSDSARGYKFNKIYVQRGVNEDFINTVLCPCIITAPRIQMETVDDETGMMYYKGVRL